MRRKGTALDAVEAAYDLSGTPSAWLTRVLAALDRLPHARGAVACAGWRFDNHAIDDVTLLRGPEGVPEMVRSLHDYVGPEQRQPRYAYAGPGLHSILDALPHLFTAAHQSQLPQLVTDTFSSLGVADFHVLLAHDASMKGCLIGWGVPERSTIDARTSQRLASLAVHVTAAHRLLAAPTTEEAVLEGDRVLHAEGAACELDAQEQLRRAARAMDRARLRGTDEDEALELWQGLVAGRWSLVDRFDSDGRRFLVARRSRAPSPLGSERSWCMRASATPTS